VHFWEGRDDSVEMEALFKKSVSDKRGSLRGPSFLTAAVPLSGDLLKTVVLSSPTWRRKGLRSRGGALGALKLDQHKPAQDLLNIGEGEDLVPYSLIVERPIPIGDED